MGEEELINKVSNITDSNDDFLKKMEKKEN